MTALAFFSWRNTTSRCRGDTVNTVVAIVLLFSSSNSIRPSMRPWLLLRWEVSRRRILLLLLLLLLLLMMGWLLLLRFLENYIVIVDSRSVGLIISSLLPEFFLKKKNQREDHFVHIPVVGVQVVIIPSVHVDVSYLGWYSPLKTLKYASKNHDLGRVEQKQAGAMPIEGIIRIRKIQYWVLLLLYVEQRMLAAAAASSSS